MPESIHTQFVLNIPSPSVYLLLSAVSYPPLSYSLSLCKNIVENKFEYVVSRVVYLCLSPPYSPVWCVIEWYILPIYIYMFFSLCALSRPHERMVYS